MVSTYRKYRDGVGPSPKGGAGADLAPSKSAVDPACKKANQQASKAIRSSRKNFEHKLASKIKDDKKSFSYARNKAKCKVQVESLVSQDGTVLNDACQIVDKFNV